MEEHQHGFTLDAFQQQAIECIKQNISVLVSAPTGAGKTLIAEYAVEECLREGKTVVYTAPIKAISNQKFRDFSQKYGSEKVGILTGDVTINREAPIILMTTEILRNTMFEGQNTLDHVGWIIFDEIHFIDDAERGTVWEEALLFCPPHTRIVGLSATVPNVQELGEWMQQVHPGPVRVIEEHKRPVPLKHCFQYENRVYTSIKDLKKQARFSSHKKRIDPLSNKGKGNRIDTLINYIQKQNATPCIYFVFSRKRAELIATEISHRSFLDEEETKTILHLYDELCERFGLSKERSAQRIRDLISCGIAFHHAGMLPSLKEVIERLFTSKLIKIICTTETFALGINMPVKCVIFDELRKYHGTHFGPLRTRDYFQMAGRAGRRGLDKFGFVYSRIDSRWMKVKEVESIVFGQPELVRSHFSSSYAVIINLYAKFGKKLLEIYPRTFHCYQSGKTAQKKAIGILNRKIQMLEELGYIRDEEILPRGKVASRVYGYELLVTELYFSGIFDELTPLDIAVLFAAIIYEPRRGEDSPQLSEEYKALSKTIKKAWRTIIRTEKRFGLVFSQKPCFNLAPITLLWCKGEPFDQLPGIEWIGQGTVIRYLRMVIQQCRQMLSVEGLPDTLKDKFHQTIDLINKDEVDAEKELREGFDS